MNPADGLAPADGAADVCEHGDCELVSGLESVSDTLGLEQDETVMRRTLFRERHIDTYMNDLIGSALLISGDLRSSSWLRAPILQEESDTAKILHLQKDLETL